MRKTLNRLAIAFLAVSLAVAGTASTAQALEQITLNATKGGQILFLYDGPGKEGGITYRDSGQLMSAYRDFSQFNEIWIWSGGGNVAGAINLGRAIRKNPAAVTRVPSRKRVLEALQRSLSPARANSIWGTLSRRFSREKCASACGIILAAGVGRLVDVTRSVGLHSMYIDNNWQDVTNEDSRSSGSLGAQWGAYMLKMGITSKYLDVAFKIHPDCMYYLSAAEMEDMNVTNVVGRNPADNSTTGYLRRSDKRNNCDNFTKK